MFVALDPKERRVDVPVMPSVPVQSEGGWVDEKWSAPVRRQPNPSKRKRKARSRKRSLRGSGNVPNPTQNKIDKNHPIPAGPGWYIVRGISADGYPGPFSKPVYISII